LKAFIKLKKWAALPLIKRVGIKIYHCLFFVAFLYALCLGMAPLNFKKQLDRHVTADTMFVEQFDPAHYHPALKSQHRQKLLHTALLSMSDDDSVQVLVNLSDSTVCLYVKGVKIHAMRMETTKTSRLLKNMPPLQYAWLFSSPLEVGRQMATTVKEPVVVRQAPKDPEEAALQAYSPDTLVQKPAFCMLETLCGIRIIMEQPADCFSKAWFTGKTFSFRIWMKDVLTSFYRFFSLQSQIYKPSVTLEMPASDIRSVYRALPLHPKVVLGL
jgi:hypothetical protein